VEELYSLDEGSFGALGDVYGLIFLFKWRKESDDRPVMDADDAPHDLFFSHQVVNWLTRSDCPLALLESTVTVSLLFLWCSMM
jgi:ubiquitin carboxyl-terminal hydrolase L5